MLQKKAINLVSSIDSNTFLLIFYSLDSYLDQSVNRKLKYRTGEFFRKINTFPWVKVFIVQRFQNVLKIKLIYIDLQTQIFSKTTLYEFFAQAINRNLYSCTGDFTSKKCFETWFRNLIRKSFQSAGVFFFSSTFKNFFSQIHYN